MAATFAPAASSATRFCTAEDCTTAALGSAIKADVPRRVRPAAISAVRRATWEANF
jgi:hypothetical protein